VISKLNFISKRSVYVIDWCKSEK